MVSWQDDARQTQQKPILPENHSYLNKSHYKILRCLSQSCKLPQKNYNHALPAWKGIPPNPANIAGLVNDLPHFTWLPRWRRVQTIHLANSVPIEF